MKLLNTYTFFLKLSLLLNLVCSVHYLVFVVTTLHGKHRVAWAVDGWRLHVVLEVRVKIVRATHLHHLLLLRNSSLRHLHLLGHGSTVKVRHHLNLVFLQPCQALGRVHWHWHLLTTRHSHLLLLPENMCVQWLWNASRIATNSDLSVAQLRIHHRLRSPILWVRHHTIVACTKVWQWIASSHGWEIIHHSVVVKWRAVALAVSHISTGSLLFRRDHVSARPTTLLSGAGIYHLGRTT